MRTFRLLLILFIAVAILLSAGCTSSLNEGNKAEETPTDSYQDREFVSLVEQSGAELQDLFSKVTESLHNSDAAGAITSAVKAMETSENYITEIEAVTVSPKLEEVQTYYLEALEDYSKAGFHYGLAGEYLKEADFTKAETFIEKAEENLVNASKHLATMYDSGE